MSDYISKTDAMERMADVIIDNFNVGLTKAYQIAEDGLDLPAADVAPVVHSRWEYKCGEIRCPECGNRIHRIDLSGYLNFCPNCGAKMDGKEQANDMG